MTVIRKGGLEWVVVRGPRLTEGEKKGRYRVGPVGENSGTSVSRTDLAHFILDQLTDDVHLGQMPVVSYYCPGCMKTITGNEPGLPEVG